MLIRLDSKIEFEFVKVDDHLIGDNNTHMNEFSNV